MNPARINGIREWVGGCIDRVSDFTRFKRIPDLWGDRAGEYEVKLDVPGLWQTDSYSCGAMVGYAAVKALKGQADFNQVYRTVGPRPGCGTARTRLVYALRRCGIGVGVRGNLNFRGIAEVIERGFPIIVTTGREGAEHWVVLYGYGRRPQRVFLMGQGCILFSKAKLSWAEFRGIWKPEGNGLVCWGR